MSKRPGAGALRGAAPQMGLFEEQALEAAEEAAVVARAVPRKRKRKEATPTPAPAPLPVEVSAAADEPVLQAPPRRMTAEALGMKQREISVSEFFVKNRHLLGFDNPQKALLTAVHECVDNSLDACRRPASSPRCASRSPASRKTDSASPSRTTAPASSASRSRGSSASFSTAASSTR